MSDNYEPGKGPNYSKRTLYGVWAFGAVLLAFIAYVGRLLGWWP